MKRLMFIVLSVAGPVAMGNGFNDQKQDWLWDESARAGLYADCESSSGSNATAMEARANTPSTSPSAAFSWLEARTGVSSVLTVDLANYGSPGFLLFIR